MASAPRTVPFRDVTPRRTELDPPQDAVDDPSMIGERTAAFGISWKVWEKCVPLGVSQFGSAPQVMRLRSTHEFSRTDPSREIVRQAQQTAHRDQVRDVALMHPMYGYRRIQCQLAGQHGQAALGRDEVRPLLRELDLTPAQPRKTRRPAIPLLTPLLWPAGRRVQIDATRFSLADGVAWVHVVMDVQTRAVLHLEVVRHLSASNAVTALQTGLQLLHRYGKEDHIVVMSDGGSEFTSQAFRQTCEEMGHWISARASQHGGMGILERVNRTLKYEWMFRQEVRSII